MTPVRTRRGCSRRLPAPVIDGFTAEQRFFLGFVQNYRTKFREAALRRQIVADILAPAPYRALTVLHLLPREFNGSPQAAVSPVFTSWLSMMM